MPPRKQVRFATLHVRPLEPRLAPSASPLGLETFDTTATGSLPSGWSQWSSDGSTPFAVSSAHPFSGPNGLAMATGYSRLAARSWVNAAAPADVQVSADVFLDTLIPAQVFARGSGLATATPTHYALAINRGLQAQLMAVTGGTATVLGTITSPDWFSVRWIQATLDVEGNTLRVQLYRPDTGQYLSASRQWQAAPTWAMQVQDNTITGAGQVGFARPSSYAGTVNFDNFGVTAPALTERFDQTPAGALPAGWAQWSSAGDTPFAVSAVRSVSAPNGLAMAATFSNTAARAWLPSYSGTDLQVSADIYVNSLIPAQVFARGTNLNGPAPSYYAVSVTRGLQVQLVRVQNGTPTVLGQLNSPDWVSDTWVRITLAVQGGELRAQVCRLDTGLYLTAARTWQASPAWALDLTDAALAGPGQAGLARPSSYAGAVTFDDFAITPAAGDTQAPAVTITAPTASTTLSGTVSVQATASDNIGVVRTALLVDGILRSSITTAPYQWNLDTTTLSNGTHTLSVLGYDFAGNVGQANLTVTVQNSGAVPQPAIPQHLPNIRIAELAYGGTPIDVNANALLQNDVDLVITDTPSLSAEIAALAPHTPQLAYTNFTNLYGSLLTDWDSWADAHGVSREAAFLHVTQPTAFSGSSPSSQPVSWLWAVYQGGTSPTFQDRTEPAHTGGSESFSLGGLGTSTYIAYPEVFGQVNFSLATGAGAGWSAVVEYPTAVDSGGNPTAWATLPAQGDTTGGFTHSGQITFTPPSNWKAATVNGSARMYYVRLRVVSDGPAPVVSTLLGADYVNAGGTSSGVIPALGTAQFTYQSRLFYANYGQMRFATNPSNPSFRAWAIDYARRYLAVHPNASGLFVDNSSDLAPVSAGAVAESVSSYSTDYAWLLNAVAQAIVPDWLAANTTGGGFGADPVVSHNTAYFEEFALRPLSGSYQQFEDLAALVAHRSALQSPAPYAILDALPAGGATTDPRTQMATLAEYYLLADPNRTFLDPFGGYAPATSWAEHFFGALTYNVGQPVGPWALLASGLDPNDTRFVYRVYQRQYGNALVLYKPLSSTPNGSSVGATTNNTATTHQLGGTYRALQADGSLGPPVTSITLRNGEGAVLIKA
jgi:hypothetical protein